MDDAVERDRLIEHVLELQLDISRQAHRCVPREWIETEVTMPQMKTLMVLYGMGEATMGELADALGIGVSTVTGIVDRLVEHGLVARAEDPRDRRVVVGRLTKTGCEVIDRVVVMHRDRMRRILEQLTTEEIGLVAKGAELLHRASLEAFASLAVS
jgi:DNA-binding MarR family transcriptional regulator